MFEKSSYINKNLFSVILKIILLKTFCTGQSFKYLKLQLSAELFRNGQQRFLISLNSYGLRKILSHEFIVIPKNWEEKRLYKFAFKPFRQVLHMIFDDI